MRAQMPSIRKRRPLILAVDDNDGVLQALHLILDEHYDVLGARDGNEALSMIRSHNVDLVLLELLIDGIDGITLLEQLRAGGVDVPVIVVSGINTAWTAAAAMRLGALEYITKPFDEGELLASVSFALRRAAEAAELRPAQQPPRILLIGCPVGLAASLTALLSPHARVESIPASGEALLGIPPVSPDAIVLDVEGSAPDPCDVLARVKSRFALAPIIVINMPVRNSSDRLRVQAERLTALFKPVRVQELLEELTVHLRPSVRVLPRFSTRVTTIIEYLSVNFAAVRVQDLGRALGKSPYYLSRLFRLETGIALTTYVNRVRIEAARQLLLETNDRIETVAARVGLHDASHLSRLFLKYSGQRPGSFRRSWREGARPVFSTFQPSTIPRPPMSQGRNHLDPEVRRARASFPSVL